MGLFGLTSFILAAYVQGGKSGRKIFKRGGKIQCVPFLPDPPLGLLPALEQVAGCGGSKMAAHGHSVCSQMAY